MLKCLYKNLLVNSDAEFMVTFEHVCTMISVINFVNKKSYGVKQKSKFYYLQISWFIILKLNKKEDKATVKNKKKKKATAKNL